MGSFRKMVFSAEQLGSSRRRPGNQGQSGFVWLQERNCEFVRQKRISTQPDWVRFAKSLPGPTSPGLFRKNPAWPEVHSSSELGSFGKTAHPLSSLGSFRRKDCAGARRQLLPVCRPDRRLRSAPRKCFNGNCKRRTGKWANSPLFYCASEKDASSRTNRARGKNHRIG